MANTMGFARRLILAWTLLAVALYGGAQALTAAQQVALFGGCPASLSQGDGKCAAVDLNFEAGVYAGGALTDLIAVSRAASGFAQTAAGTLTSFSSNVARLTDRGLLIEEARTNLALQSQDLSTTWTLSNATVTTDSTAAPDGTTTADTLTDNNTNAAHRIQQAGISFTSGTTYTFSGYVKAGTDNKIQLTFLTGAFSGAGYANFDLTGAGAVAATGGTLVGSGIQALGNGWYWVWIIATATSTTSNGMEFCRIATTSDTRQPTYIGSSTTVFVWGSQVEAGGFPTSYIPTTTASVTRAADNITATGALDATFRGSRGTSLAKFAAYSTAATGGNGNFRLWDQNSGALALIGNPAGNGTMRQRIAGADIATANTYSNLATSKAAGSWSPSAKSIALDGGAVATTTGASFTAGTTNIGNASGLANALNGTLKRLAVWNVQLSDSALGVLSR